ncbi:MAG: histidine phosphatase family protein [Candidatus Kaiserbacteria bacterium]|nr:histidine phosphatase family protein [Candidatus Kaiserbacteria bacterium]
MDIGKLIIARHHESKWNKLGVWTGSRDIGLTQHGKEMSIKMGALIKDTRVDCAFASQQVRSLETLTMMLEAIGRPNIPIERSQALDERDYGDYTGKNKLEMKQLLGKEAYDRVHREWDCPIPNGETIKMVYERAVPYYKNVILPVLLAGKNVLMVSHGNAIRALMKYIENIPDKEVRNLEMLFGSVIVYGVDQIGQMTSKETRELKSRESHMHA